MFRIRVYTPAVVDDAGWQHAGAELQLGNDRLRFSVDLTYWPIAEYERQWRDATRRLAAGAPASAFVTAWRGPDAESHELWALWREEDHVYVQTLTVLARDLDEPFDPHAPWQHVGARIPATEAGLPISEWRVDLLPFLAHAFGLRLPNFPLLG